MKAYFPWAQVSRKNLKRKKTVKPGEAVTPNRPLALMQLVKMRTRKRCVGALLVVDVPADRALYHEGEFIVMKRRELKVLAHEHPTPAEYRVAAVEVRLTEPWVRNMETDVRTGDIRAP